MQTPTETTLDYFGSLASGDVPAALAKLSPEVVWHQPGDHQFAGDYRGLDAVGAHLGTLMQASGGTFQLAVDGPAMSNGDLVAVPVRFSGRRGSAVLDMAGIDLLTVHDGLITVVHLFSADGAAEDRFWDHAPTL